MSFLKSLKQALHKRGQPNVPINISKGAFRHQIPGKCKVKHNELQLYKHWNGYNEKAVARAYVEQPELGQDSLSKTGSVY